MKPPISPKLSEAQQRVQLSKTQEAVLWRMANGWRLFGHKYGVPKLQNMETKEEILLGRRGRMTVNVLTSNGLIMGVKGQNFYVILAPKGVDVAAALTTPAPQGEKEEA